jgi:hypothetical protein
MEAAATASCSASAPAHVSAGLSMHLLLRSHHWCSHGLS